MNSQVEFIHPHAPNVIYIGLMKTATHFLRSYFDNHEEINWSRKAQYFRLDEQYYDKSIGYYNPEGKSESCFIEMFEGLGVGWILKRNIMNCSQGHRQGEGRFSPESTVFGCCYICDPLEIGRRIYKTLPEAKILIGIRNQTDWLRSCFIRFVAGSNRSKDKYRQHNDFGVKNFSGFITTPDGKSFLDGAFNDRTIRGYIDLFGEGKVHVMLFEQIRDDWYNVTKNLCVFLDINFQSFPSNKGDKNASRFNRLNLISEFKKKLRGQKDEMTRSLVRSTILGDVLSKRDKTFIKSSYAASNCRTSKLIGLDIEKYGYYI